MGQSKTKKRKGGGGAREAAKSAHLDGDHEAISNELLDLATAYKDDFKITSESPHTHLSIHIRSYSDSKDFEELQISAILNVRYFPGYPHKCPEFWIKSDKYLSKEDANQLLSMLVGKANTYSQQGRVMIVDLIKAAETFLSKIAHHNNSANSSHQLGLNVTNHETDVGLVHKLENSPTASYICSSFELHDQLYDGVGHPHVAKNLLQDNDLQEANPKLNNSAAESTDTINASEQHQFEMSSEDSSFQGSKESSRYLDDFEEICLLGKGGYAHVALCKHKLDGCQYAVKKIHLKDQDPQKVLREVAALSRLKHPHVVGYHQAWVETEYGHYQVLSNDGSPTMEPSTKDNRPSDAGSSHVENESSIKDNKSSDAKSESTKDIRSSHAVSRSSIEGIQLSGARSGDKQEGTLYIQMEYCPRTLSQAIGFKTDSSSDVVDHAWRIFRQIVEGLAYIHEQGIIHQDLAPRNIFFDLDNNIKIGDFGLAKFLKQEQLDDNQNIPTEEMSVSIDEEICTLSQHYHAPEIKEKWPKINQKADIYSLGVIFFELWHRFETLLGRGKVLRALNASGDPPIDWVTRFPREANLLKRLLSRIPSDRPSTMELLQNELPPQIEDKCLNGVLKMIQKPEDNSVYDRVISAIFSEDRVTAKWHCQHDDSKKSSCISDSSELIDSIIEVSKEVFKQHCAKRFPISPWHTPNDKFTENRGKAVKILTQGGDLLDLCYELRTPFIMSVAANQITSFKHYEISWVHRRAAGHSTPYRLLQGDFDIIGGTSPIPEAEAIKVSMDIGTRFSHSNAIVVRLSHGKLVESVCSWAGVPREKRHNVAELFSSSIVKYQPASAGRKLNWNLIRGQLLQDLGLSEAIVKKLRKADLQFCGSADRALARLREILSHDKSACKALNDLSLLLNCLRVWSIEKHITIDILMPPSECYYTDIFFQVYSKEGNLGSSSNEKLLAVGGRYDWLMERMWDKTYKSTSPGVVGVSISLEKIFAYYASVDIQLSRIESSTSVLVCSKEGGLLKERMELVSELWQANIKSQFVPQQDPSLQEQYEYARDHDIKCLVFITKSDSTQSNFVKVQHRDTKEEKKVKRDEIVEFLSDSICAQFKNPTI